MFQIPGFMLKQLYVSGSLRNTETGFRFLVCNPIFDRTISGVHKVANNRQDFELSQIRAAGWAAYSVTTDAPVNFPRGAELEVEVKTEPLPCGRHNLYVKVETVEWGPLKVDVFDRV